MSRPVPPESFAIFRDRLKNKFPTAQNIRYVASHLQFEGEDSVKTDVSNTMFGVRLDDAERLWVVQGKSDGLAVSRLPPYESWDGLIAAVREVWPVYVETFQPDAVLRLGVRYINKIPLPEGESVDLDKVLTGAPKIPPILPQNLTEFVTRVVLPIEAEGIVLAIAQAMGSAAAAGPAHVVLDIDAACEESFAPESQEMWGKLAALREAKNVAFFGSLMEDTWRKFL
ncbi:MAG: TIGR04255 family protein [Nitrososphaera sp.]